MFDIRPWRVPRPARGCSACPFFPGVPGTLATVGLVDVMPSWTDLYHSAWSLGFGTSLLVYSGLTLRRPGGAALPGGS
jgi:cytosine/uracil/thiamine/allantoin permease